MFVVYYSRKKYRSKVVLFCLVQNVSQFLHVDFEQIHTSVCNIWVLHHMAKRAGHFVVVACYKYYSVRRRSCVSSKVHHLYVHDMPYTGLERPRKCQHFNNHLTFKIERSSENRERASQVSGKGQKYALICPPEDICYILIHHFLRRTQCLKCLYVPLKEAISKDQRYTVQL